MRKVWNLIDCLCGVIRAVTSPGQPPLTHPEAKVLRIRIGIETLADSMEWRIRRWPSKESE